MSKWKPIVFAGGLLALLAVGVLASYLEAQLFVHHPKERRSILHETPADYQLPYEKVELETEDGFHLAAWYVPSQNQAAVIVVHGYKGDRSLMLPRAQKIAQHGYGVLLIDLRAHGESEGELISFGLNEVRDVEAAYRYLLNRPDIDPDKIGALGVSMGGTVVLLSAAQNTGLKTVVAESAFATLPDAVPSAVASTGLPPAIFAPVVQWFAEREVGFKAEQVSAVDAIGKISPRPVLLMQGGKDLVVMPDGGQRLYDAAGEPRELWFEPELGHTAFIEELPEMYKRRVIEFLDTYLLGNPATGS